MNDECGEQMLPRKDGNMKIEQLEDEQLLELRRQICLNSIYLSDYENDLGVDRQEAYDFFDGYTSYLEELMAESDPGFDDSMFDERLGEYDTELNLLEWFSIWLS